MQSPYTKSAASDWVTHVCCDAYYGPESDANAATWIANWITAGEP